MLFDLHGMDERLRTHRDGLPAADFSVFYHLISVDRNRDIMLKVALSENDLHLPTFTKMFPNANWYERETWEMFGVTFDGHPNLRRIMMPPTWEGHPLRKDYPARATEFDPFELTKAKQDLEKTRWMLEALRSDTVVFSATSQPASVLREIYDRSKPTTEPMQIGSISVNDLENHGTFSIREIGRAHV